MESVSLDKWEAAIGPIGPLCKSIDRIQTRKEKHYEDKFMCSFYDLNASSHCNIMSIGSNDQWGFETEVMSVTGCHTHTLYLIVQYQDPSTSQILTPFPSTLPVFLTKIKL